MMRILFLGVIEPIPKSCLTSENIYANWCHLCIIFVENCGSLRDGFMPTLITILFHDNFVHYCWDWDPCWSLQGCLPCFHWHQKWYNGTNMIQNILEKVHKAPGWCIMHPTIILNRIQGYNSKHSCITHPWLGSSIHHICKLSYQVCVWKNVSSPHYKCQYNQQRSFIWQIMYFIDK